MTYEFSNYDPNICDLCNSTKFRVIFNVKGRVLLTNNSIIHSRLKKIECTRCGLIRGGTVWNRRSLKKHYTQLYGKHVDTNENSIFFTKSGSEERSTSVAKWIFSILKSIDLSEVRTIVEIGSGAGSLISKLKNEHPDKKIIGFEANEEAVATGKSKGLDIRLLNSITKLSQVDLVICYAVIEHTPSPTEFLKSIVRLLNKNGYIILGQPQQDGLSTDIFYQDHLYHFATSHIRDLGRKVNLVEIKKSMGKRSLSNFSLHLFRLSKKKQFYNVIKKRTNVSQSIQYYTRIFKNLNKTLKTLDGKSRLAVFGTSHFFYMFYTYSNLWRRKIMLGIDDFLTPKKLPFRIITSSELKNEHIDTILFCLNPIYVKIVQKRLKNNKYQYILPFSKK